MLRQKQSMKFAGTSWMIPGDHIAVALSGDKSSSALLYFLKKLTSNRRDIRISAISIDEGIAGYRDPAYALQIAELLDTECITVSFQENFGITVRCDHTQQKVLPFPARIAACSGISC